MTLRWKSCLLTVAAGALFLLGSAGIAEARPDRNCSARIDNEVRKLDRDISKHGYFSRQAQNRREKIQRLRQECGFAGFFGRDRDDRRWDRRDGDRDDRRGHRDRDDWYWDGRRWRHRER